MKSQYLFTDKKHSTHCAQT